MARREDLRKLYSKARVFVHAMGYGYTNPADTEHFGIAVEKAALSGCWTVAHASGGAPEMAKRTWVDLQDLSEVFEEAVAASNDMALAEISGEHKGRTWQAFRERVAEEFAR